MKSNFCVMSWNLLEGACVREGGRPIPRSHTQRLEAAKALVERVSPDVLILNEALWCESFDGQQRDYATLFGFPHQAAHLYDKAWGNAILSRFPIASIRPFRIYNRGGLVVATQTPAGLVEVGTYHPHPSRYAHHKALDFETLLGLFSPMLPGIIGGDFNAISPDDHPDIERLTQGFSRFSQQPRRDCLRFVEGGQTIFPLLTVQGWSDAVADHGLRDASIPTRLLSDDQDSAMRIDHLWYNPGLSLAEASVLRDPLADVASDHYPLVGRFVVPSQPMAAPTG